jgi:hypothetical protein
LPKINRSHWYGFRQNNIECGQRRQNQLDRSIANFGGIKEISSSTKVDGHFKWIKKNIEQLKMPIRNWSKRHSKDEFLDTLPMNWEHQYSDSAQTKSFTMMTTFRRVEKAVLQNIISESVWIVWLIKFWI